MKPHNEAVLIITIGLPLKSLNFIILPSIGEILSKNFSDIDF